MIQPVVEGDGEVAAVPVLLRRLMAELGVYDVRVNRCILIKRQQLPREADFRAKVQLATAKSGVRAVLVLADLDEDCARNLVPNLTRWASEETFLPCAIVLARREYEAWFLASLESLRSERGVRENASYVPDPEAKGSAKDALSRFMPRNAPYQPTTHQAAFSARFDLAQAYQRASSFRKLVRELCRVLTACDHQPIIPDDWTA